LVVVFGGIVLTGFYFFLHTAPTMRVCGKSHESTGVPSQLPDDKKNPMAIRPVRFSRERALIKRAEGRRASHPVFGETVLSARSKRTGGADVLRGGERAGLLTSESFSGPAFPSLFGIVAFLGPSSSVTAAQPSGIYTRFSILLGPQPQALFSHTDPQYFVALSKNYTRYRVFPFGLSIKQFRMTLISKRLRTFSIPDQPLLHPQFQLAIPRRPQAREYESQPLEPMGMGAIGEIWAQLIRAERRTVNEVWHQLGELV
jgi:hypothetical protein